MNAVWHDCTAQLLDKGDHYVLLAKENETISQVANELDHGCSPAEGGSASSGMPPLGRMHICINPCMCMCMCMSHQVAKELDHGCSPAVIPAPRPPSP